MAALKACITGRRQVETEQLAAIRLLKISSTPTCWPATHSPELTA